MVVPEGFLTLDEAAKQIGCTRFRVERLVSSGQLLRHVSAADKRRVLVPADQVKRLAEPMPLPVRRASTANGAQAA